MSDDFAGLRAVVTGGASGIGAATVRELAARGAAVTVLDRDLHGAPEEARLFTCDITDDAEVQSAMRHAVSTMGGLDVLVNNAGAGAVGHVGENADEEWRRLLDLNVIGLARVTRAALPALRASTHAVVINTCSVVASVGVVDRVLYSATKGAVAAMTQAMAADHVQEGIRVNAVMPGTTNTPWVGRLLASAPAGADVAAEALRRRQPMGRLIEPEEVAHAICYLASPRSASTTGTLLAVDGGMASLRGEFTPH